MRAPLGNVSWKAKSMATGKVWFSSHEVLSKWTWPSASRLISIRHGIESHNDLSPSVKEMTKLLSSSWRFGNYKFEWDLVKKAAYVAWTEKTEVNTGSMSGSSYSSIQVSVTAELPTALCSRSWNFRWARDKNTSQHLCSTRFYFQDLGQCCGTLHGCIATPETFTALRRHKEAGRSLLWLLSSRLLRRKAKNKARYGIDVIIWNSLTIMELALEMLEQVRCYQSPKYFHSLYNLLK